MIKCTTLKLVSVTFSVFFSLLKKCANEGMDSHTVYSISHLFFEYSGCYMDVCLPLVLCVVCLVVILHTLPFRRLFIIIYYYYYKDEMNKLLWINNM